MASKVPSSAPMFIRDDWYGILDEDSDTDPITLDRGANQFLGHQANHHDGQSTVAPGVGNRVQAGALKLINSESPLGRPTKSSPLGASNHG